MTTPNKIQSDLLVIGGRINGAVTECDVAGRNGSVCLAEMQDFAEGTSSRSLRLIPDGLRYLETYDLRMVRDALLG
jgi:glycerol-3-phosphate dehydrogenase